MDIKIKVILFLFACFCNTFIALGQQKIVIDTLNIAGVLFDKNMQSPLSNVNCKYDGKVVVSDHKGRFHIKVSKNDTINFSHIGYATYKYVVPDTMYHNEYSLAVFMSQDTIALSEVVVIARFLPKDTDYMRAAKNNMQGVAYSAYFPKEMDASMNQRMGIEQFATSIEMKGHVKVGLSVGTHSLEALKHLKLKDKLESQRYILSDIEIGLLKRLYNHEK